MRRMRVLLVDDQELFVRNLQIVLESRTEDIEVVGIAHNGREACACVRDARPDIVLMDVRMPEMDGVEATRLIHERHPAVRIVVLTTFDDDEYVYHALEYGAVGYLLKNIPPEELFACIRAVHGGALLISPQVKEKVMGARTRNAARPPAAAARDVGTLLAGLTGKERDILRLIALAYTNRQIAEHLMIAEQTVKNHISIIYSKMGVSRRMELMGLLRDVDPEELQGAPRPRY
jgi:DNA-binding NarL/FixJ family response regulator